MTKAELVEKVANQINLTKKQTEVVVNTVFSSITDSLAEGKKVEFSSPRDSQNLGIEMVYQDLALAENLPIGDNIFLGREPTKKFGPVKILDHKRS